MKRTSDERYQQIFGKQKAHNSHYWIQRAEATATEGTADGNTKEKQTSCSKKPRNPEGLGRTVYGRQGWDGAWGKGSRHQWFSTQHLFLTQPLTCLPFLLPGRMLSPSLSVMVWPWDSEEDMGIESEKHGANTGKQWKQAQRVISPDWNRKTADFVNVRVL